MNVGDWIVAKVVGRSPLLYHDHGGWKHLCWLDEKGVWYCGECRKNAPPEIQFAADLCHCQRGPQYENHIRVTGKGFLFRK